MGMVVVYDGDKEMTTEQDQYRTNFVTLDESLLFAWRNETAYSLSLDKVKLINKKQNRI